MLTDKELNTRTDKIKMELDLSQYLKLVKGDPMLLMGLKMEILI